MKNIKYWWWLALVSSAAAHAQQGLLAVRDDAQCEIPSISFWSPPKAESGPVEVDVEFVLLDIVEINDRRNSFVVDFALTLTWTDHRLDTVTSSDGGCTSLLADIWHPQLIFLNAGEASGDYDGVVEVLPGGTVIYSKRVTREFSADLDFRDFPYDKQALVVYIASMLYAPEDVRFVTSEGGVEVLNGARIQGWRIGSLTSAVPEQPIQTKASSHSSLSFTVRVERESGYYFWRLVFPLLMITLMAWAVFWLEPANLGPQVAVATGAVFSLMALLVSQGQVMPTVSYTSAADRLIVACVVLVFAAFGEAVSTGILSQAGHVKLARTIDRVGRWVYLSAVVILFVVFN